MIKPLHCQVHGKVDANTPVIVLIHGLFGSADNLSVIRRHFEGEYKVLSIDLPDHGQSPWSETFSFEQSAKQVAASLDAQGVKQAYFVAHSLGAKVAMYFAYLFSERVTKLVCLDIAPVAYEPRHENVLTGLSNVDMNQVTSRKDAQKMLAEYVQDAGTQAFLLKSLVQEGRTWRWRFNLDLLKQQYPVLSAWQLSDAHVFSGEVLFIKGKQSDYILAQHQSTIMHQFPSATAKVVDAGHWLHAEKPTIINSLITKFLRGN